MKKNLKIRNKTIIAVNVSPVLFTFTKLNIKYVRVYYSLIYIGK
jgi:hypothetical protein